MAELSDELLAEVKRHTVRGYTRICNGLREAGVRTKDDILRLGRTELMRTPGLALQSVITIGKIVGEDWSEANPLRNVPTEVLLAETQRRARAESVTQHWEEAASDAIGDATHLIRQGNYLMAVHALVRAAAACHEAEAASERARAGIDG